MKLKKLAVVASLLLGSSLTHAATIFSDNFDSYLADQYEWIPSASTGWTVTGGSVDLHGAGGGNDRLPGNGSYVDLDGSTFSSGMFANSVNLTSGTTYVLSFDLAGPQLGFRSEIVDVNFGSATGSYIISSTDPFSTYTLSFTPTSSGSYGFSYQNFGGDNRGAFLDNVSVSSVGDAVSPIPEPETYTMLLTGLAVMTFVACRRGKTPTA